MRRARGFTLIELVAFIAIAGVVAVALVQAFAGTGRGAHLGKEIVQATQLAQQRMELIAGQRKWLGYAGFTAATYDPCPPVGTWSTVAPAPCATSSYAAGNYTVATAASFVNDACGAGSGTNCRQVTVTVTSPYGEVLARLTAQFWDY